ncbi:unnamed protein product, partial [Musa acuminata subsp. burmannicoides]
MQKNKKITSIKVVHANGREPGLTQYKDALLITNLPDGPTTHCQLCELVLRKDTKVHLLHSSKIHKNKKLL